jgi:molybdate transport system regulatory protein
MKLKPPIHLRVLLGSDIAMGPGKADLLQGIQQTGSIAAAGRLMSMSYKRAWYLVEAMNQAFRSPLVEASKGGKTGGGARLTTLGETVLKLYRRMERRCAARVAPDLQALRKLLVRQ